MKKKLAYVKILKEILESEEFNKLSLTELGYSSLEEANKLVFSNPMAFFIGLVFDQGISSERAWTVPFYLQNRLGHLEPTLIAKMSVETLTEVLREGKSLHRYPSTMANNLITSCNLLIESFEGKPENIWKSKKYKETKLNFLKMRGIGEKKANLGLLMLMRDHGVIFLDGSNIPLALDSHLRRVLSRSGLFNIKTKEGIKEVIDSMKIISPELPSSLGTAVWYVGKNYCDNTHPLCILCPLSTVCKKIT